MLHKFFSRSAVVAAMMLGSTLAQAHDGANHWVTLTANSYTLWSNTASNSIIRISLKVADYYNPAGICRDVDSYMVSSALSAEARQRIYSTLLAAKLAGRPVKLYVDSDACEDARPRVLNVAID